MTRSLIFAVALLTAGTAYAQTAAPESRAAMVKSIDQNFDKGDTNNDGFISRAELQGVTARAAQEVVNKMEGEFNQMDRDKNGSVTLAEFKAFAAAKLAGNSQVTLDRLDTNKDGKISPAEFRAPMTTAFDRVDTNKDGKLSPEEKKKAGVR